MLLISLTAALLMLLLLLVVFARSSCDEGTLPNLARAVTIVDESGIRCRGAFCAPLPIRTGKEWYGTVRL